jgi:DNA modification methylase
MKVSEVKNMCCMIGMAQYPDKFFDLAIVDPPYGIGVDNMGLGKGKKITEHKNKYADIRPPSKYFKELIRVSKNQIIWGGNYFSSAEQILSWLGHHLIALQKHLECQESKRIRSALLTPPKSP